MNKSTKGALAAAAAGSLLLGGAGSLAYWTGTQDVTGGAIDSGQLVLAAPVCNAATDAATHDWLFDGNTPFIPGTSKIVPGDTISKVCKMTLTIAGDHVGADLAIAIPVLSDAGTLDNELTKSATFTIGGQSVTSVTDPGTYVVLATVNVGFPSTVNTTTGQNVATTLSAITLTATQSHTP